MIDMTGLDNLVDAGNVDQNGMPRVKLANNK